MTTDLFTNWFESAAPEITKVQDLLSRPLSDNPSELQNQIVEIEAWNARVTSMLAWAHSFLAASERENLLKRGTINEFGKEVTDLDRETYLADAVKDERRAKDIMSGLCDAIRTRTILGMSLMKIQSGERFAGRSNP